MTSEKYLTISHQKILLVMYNNSHKTNFYNQTIYKNYRSFERAMRQLINAKIIKIKPMRIDKQYTNMYILTYNGILAVEEVIKDFIDNNK